MYVVWTICVSYGVSCCNGRIMWVHVVCTICVPYAAVTYVSCGECGLYNACGMPFLVCISMCHVVSVICTMCVLCDRWFVYNVCVMWCSFYPFYLF